jgi:polyferredoxin
LSAERLSRLISRTWAAFMVLSALTGAIFIYTGPPRPVATVGAFALVVVATLACTPAAQWLAEVWCRRLGPSGG